MEFFYVWKIVFFVLGINIWVRKLKFVDECDVIYFRNMRIFREFLEINFFKYDIMEIILKKLEEEINVG